MRFNSANSATPSNEVFTAHTAFTKSLEDTGNLFVSADDRKLVGRQVKKVAKQLEELNVKLINAKQLL